MKKKFTLISALSIVGFTFAQKPALPVMEQKVKLATTIVENKEASSTEKAPGDILWSNNFSSTANWTISNVLGSTAPNFGWQLSPTQDAITTWFFTSETGNFTGGGGYAGCENGNPQAGTSSQDVDAEWILTYDSIFDFSSVTNLLIEFQQYGARFTDKQAVEVSTDGGTTWIEVGSNDDIPALTGAGGAAFTNPTNRSYNISQALNGASTANLKFRFRVYWPAAVPAGNKGIMYGWFIDNVKFVEGQPNDIKINEAQHLTGDIFWQYTKIPTAQAAIANNVFTSTITNLGSNSQDVVLTVTNGSGLNQNGSLTLPGFAKDTIDILTGYTLPTALGNVTYNFAATSTNNTLANTTDDVVTSTIEVTQGVYATDKYTNTPTSMTGYFTAWATQTGNPGIGNVFEIFEDATAYSIQIGIGNVTAANQAPFLNQDFKGAIYERNAADTDWQLLAETDFRTLVATDFGKIATIYFTPGNEPQLVAGKFYMVLAESFDNAEVPVAFAGNQPAGQTFGKNGPGSFVSLASSPATPTIVSAPVVRLGFVNDLSVNESTITELSTYPNPTTGNVSVKFNLNAATNATVSVRDLTGRTVYTSTANDLTAGAQEMNINLEAFDAGSYIIEIQAGASKITKQIVKK